MLATALNLSFAVDQDYTIHEIYYGGSDAVTALIEKGGVFFIRKSGAGDAGGRLRIQSAWLRENKGAGLPLAPVLAERRHENIYSYDMPLIPAAVNFYDAVQVMTAEAAWADLSAILDVVASFHKENLGPIADKKIVTEYIKKKIIGNMEKILEFTQPLIGENRFIINGMDYDLAYLNDWLDMSWLIAQMTSLQTTSIHGDLTIENIVKSSAMPQGFYLIDPNPENIFETHFIDWAKMMQSLHLGYEKLAREKNYQLGEGGIEIPLLRPNNYSALHSLFEKEIVLRFGEEGLRQVYFHEIVNYLRLIIYKIRKIPLEGLVFFACLNILVRRYRDRWA